MKQEASPAPENGHGQEIPFPVSNWLEEFVSDDVLFEDEHGKVPLKSHPGLGKYDSVEEMAKALLHAQSLVGKKALGLKRPPEDAGTQEHEQFDKQLRQMLGVPQSGEEYDLSGAAENMPAPETLHWYRDAACTLGLTNDQAKGLLEKYQSVQGQYFREREVARQEGLRELTTHFAGDIKQCVEHARRGFEITADQAGLDKESQEELLNAYGDDPVMIRLFHAIGTHFAEDSLVVSNAGPHNHHQTMPIEQFFANEVFGNKGE